MNLDFSKVNSVLFPLGNVISIHDENKNLIWNKAQDEVKRYTVTVSLDNDRSGTIQGSGTYKEGSSVNIVYSPNEGYNFEHWSDGSFSNPNNITSITSNVDLTCFTDKIQYSITYINVEDDELNKDEYPITYTVEDEIIFKPLTDKNGYSFKAWNPSAIEVGTVEDKEIEAIFTPKSYNILTSGTNGSIIVDTSGLYNQTVNISSIADTLPLFNYSLKNIVIFDDNGNQISSSKLSSMEFCMNEEYYPLITVSVSYTTSYKTITAKIPYLNSSLPLYDTDKERCASSYVVPFKCKTLDIVLHYVLIKYKDGDYKKKEYMNAVNYPLPKGTVFNKNDRLCYTGTGNVSGSIRLQAIP